MLNIAKHLGMLVKKVEHSGGLIYGSFDETRHKIPRIAMRARAGHPDPRALKSMRRSP